MYHDRKTSLFPTCSHQQITFFTYCHIPFLDFLEPGADFFRVKIGIQELIAGHHGGVAVPGAVLVAEKENAKWACIFEMVDGRESIRRTTIQQYLHT